MESNLFFHLHGELPREIVTAHYAYFMVDQFYKSDRYPSRFSATICAPLPAWPFGVGLTNCYSFSRLDINRIGIHDLPFFRDSSDQSGVENITHINQGSLVKRAGQLLSERNEAI